MAKKNNKPDLSKEEVDLAKELTSTIKEMAGDIKDSSNGFKELISGMKEFNDLSEIQKEIREYLDVLGEDMTEHQQNMLEGMLKYTDGLKGAKDQWDLISEKASGMADDMTSALTSPIEKGLDLIPGVGKHLKGMIPTDAIKGSIQKSITGPLMKAGMTGVEGMVATEGAAVAAGGASLAALGPVLLILAAIAAAAYVLKKAFDLDKETSEIAQNFGKTKEEAKAFSDEIKMAGVLLKDGVEIVSAYRDMMGDTGDLTAETVAHADEMAKSLGMSNDEVGKLVGLAHTTGQEFSEWTDQLDDGVAEMNKQTGGAVDLKQVLKEVGNASADTLAIFGDNTKELGKAAVQSKLLGISLNQMAQISKGLFDIESSIGAQMEANVLTGKQMNMDRARALALEGDIAGAAREMMEQVGSLEDFNKMNIIQKEAVAKAAGMEVGELQKSLAIAEKQKAIGDDNLTQIAKIQKARAEGDMDEVKRLETKFRINANAAAKEELAAQNRQSMMDKLSHAWEKIQQVFWAIVAGPVEEFMHEIESVVQEMGGMDVILASVQMYAGYLVQLWKVLTIGMRTTINQIKGIFKIFGGIGKLLKGDISGGLKQIGSGIFDFLIAPFKTVLSTIVGIVDWVGSLFGATWDLGGIIDEYLTFDKLIEGATWLWDWITGLGPMFEEMGSIILDVLLRPFDLISGYVDGISQIFSGDLLDGILTIGQSLIDFVVSPLIKALELANMIPGVDLDSTISSVKEMTDIGGRGGVGDAVISSNAAQTQNTANTITQANANSGNGKVVVQNVMQLDDGSVMKLNGRQKQLNTASQGMDNTYGRV